MKIHLDFPLRQMSRPVNLWRIKPALSTTRSCNHEMRRMASRQQNARKHCRFVLHRSERFF
jgi:hypothetical protein